MSGPLSRDQGPSGPLSGDQGFSARSVVASLLLGTSPPRMPAATLVQAATLFGIAEGTTRVALSRMVGAGELTTDGRHYRLAGALLERHGRQQQGRHPALRPWDGTWRMAVVGSGGTRRSAPERASVRRRLDALRLAEWREGVWLRPDNLRPDNLAPATVPETPQIDGCSWLIGVRFVDDAEATQTVARLWDLPRWTETATQLRSAMAASPPAASLAANFRLAARVVRHLRDDPLLPDALLPPDWSAPQLRADYDRYESAFQRALRQVMRGLAD